MSTRANIRITATDTTRGVFARVSQSLRGLQGSVTSLLAPFSALRSILPALGLAILAKQSVQAAESIRTMDARIRRATQAVGDFTRVQRELYQISQANSVALTDTGNLFISINRAAEDLGRGRNEVLQLTDTIQKLGIISGATDEEMKNSLRQFSQAMAGGVVRAEEFNSILENTPEIMNAIATGMGKTVGQLRMMMLDGGVLANDVFDSLLSQTERISAEAAKMPMTIGWAFQNLKNAMGQFIADANEAGGATEGIALRIRAIADAIDDLNVRVRSGELALEFSLWMETMTEVGAQVDWLKSKFSELTPGGAGIDFAWSDFFKDLPALMTIAFTEIFAAVDRGIETIRVLWLKLPALWDKMWLGIATKAKKWWAEITHIFSDESSLDDALEKISNDQAKAMRPIQKELDNLSAAYEDYAKRSRDTVAAIREEQTARMDQRRGMVEVNRALEELMDSNNELFGFQQKVTQETKAQTAATQGAGVATDNTAEVLKKYGFILDDVSDETVILNRLLDTGRISWDQYSEAVMGVSEAVKETAASQDEIVGAIEETTDAIFDMGEAMKQVQNNIQQGFSDLFFDLFSGKGVDSFKDFADRVLDIFKRLLADMAAAWAASKIFEFFGMKTGGVNFNLGSLMGNMGGGGPGGGSGGTGGGGMWSAISNSAMGQAVKTWAAKTFGGATAGSITSASPGALGSVKGPAVMNYGAPQAGAQTTAGASSGGMTAAGGALVVAAIAAFGAYQQGKSAKQRARRQGEFFNEVGTGTSESLGEGMWDYRGSLNDAEAFFSTTRAGWQSTLAALHEAGVLTKGWGAALDENGNGLVKMNGDIEGIKRGLEGAAVTGFNFSSSIDVIMEKGGMMRTQIVGDADAIKSALNAATAMGIGGFTGLQETATGVTVQLTGDIVRWQQFLQGFVNESIAAAVNGVNSIGSAADSATGKFLAMAKAAASVRVPSGINGGRAVQDAGGVQRFAKGGIARQASIFGEAGPEAAVPLPDGRTIPVTIKGGMSNDSVVAAIKRQTRELVRRSRRHQFQLAPAK